MSQAADDRAAEPPCVGTAEVVEAAALTTPTGDHPRAAVGLSGTLPAESRASDHRPGLPTQASRQPGISSRVLRSREALSFLALGLTYSQTRFDEVVDMLADFLRPATGSDRGELPLREALLASVKESLSAVGDPAVRIGLTGGLDSRLLYGALRQFYEPDRITPYTFGYPGQYDYEFVRKYGGQFLENHLVLETREITWDATAEVEKRRALGNAGTYNSKSILYQILSQRGVPAHNIHGFMGDPLTGATKPDVGRAVDSWDDAVRRFLKKNDRFNLQNYLSDQVDLTKLLPPRPANSVTNLDDYELLDFGLRQFQRILRDTGGDHTTITPYTNKKWINALVGIGDTRTRESVYYRFIRDEFSTYFPEFQQFKITSRADHKKFRAKVMADSLDGLAHLTTESGSKFRPQVRSEEGGLLAGRQFCEYAEYRNNGSFRVFFDDLYEGLLERKLFSHRLLADVRQRFLTGSKIAAEQMKGLMSLELNVRAGTLEL